MIRELVGLSLILTAVALFLFSWFLVRSERIRQGRWVVWPPGLIALLAARDASFGVLLLILGVLTVTSPSHDPVELWGIALVVAILGFTLAFWWRWARNGGDGGH